MEAAFGVDNRRPHQQGEMFFAGLAEYAFETRLGVADPPLVDYIARLLARFIHCDAIYNVRNLTGKQLQEVAEMLIEAEARVGDARRQVHRHIGDFTLFWSGLFPEAVRRMQRGRMDELLDYYEQGKRAYLIAGSIPVENDDGENDVLVRLSAEFELCVYGLGEVRREWERRDPGPRPA